MKSLTIAFFLLIAVSCYALSGATSPKRPRCPIACTREFLPVCGTWTRGGKTSVCTFSNLCALNNQKCQRNQDWSLHSRVACKWPTRDCKTLLRPIKM